METGNVGMVGVTETRTNINAMKELYRTEYKKLVDKEKESDSKLFRNKWRLRFGGFSARVALTFQRNGVFKSVSRLSTHLFGIAGEKFMKWRNKKNKEKIKKQKDKLTADFINADGIFSEYSIPNPATIEKIEEQEEIEEEKGFHR